MHRVKKLYKLQQGVQQKSPATQSKTPAQIVRKLTILVSPPPPKNIPVSLELPHVNGKRRPSKRRLDDVEADFPVP